MYCNPLEMNINLKPKIIFLQEYHFQICTKRFLKIDQIQIDQSTLQIVKLIIYYYHHYHDLMNLSQIVGLIFHLLNYILFLMVILLNRIRQVINIIKIKRILLKDGQFMRLVLDLSPYLHNFIIGYIIHLMIFPILNLMLAIKKVL